MTLPIVFAAELADQTVTAWVVGVILTSIVGALGFLIKQAIDGVQNGLAANTAALAATRETLGGKLDVIKAEVATERGDRRVLEARMVAVERIVERLERTVEQLSEGVAR